jgi:hypothetical protein
MAAMTEFEAMELEERKLRLELMKDQVATLQAAKDKRRINLLNQKQSDDFNRAKTAREQAACSHRKGGKGIEQIFKGGDSEYSVIKHTEPWGETYVKCQRCGKEARDPFYMLRKLNPAKVSEAKKKDAREYNRIMAEYKQWMDFPTDNSPSGGTVFQIQRDVDYDAVAV